jgi:hypothetical protein
MMKMAIDYPTPIFYTVYLEQPPHSFKIIGTYSDIRDAVQAIATAYRRNGGDYSIESSPNRPKHWLHPTRYRNDR